MDVFSNAGISFEVLINIHFQRIKKELVSYINNKQLFKNVLIEIYNYLYLIGATLKTLRFVVNCRKT